MSDLQRSLEEARVELAAALGEEDDVGDEVAAAACGPLRGSSVAGSTAPAGAIFGCPGC